MLNKVVQVYNILMKFVLKILKKTITKVLLVIMFLLLGFCIFFYWGWFEKQINKCFGFYYIYKGDKAQRGGNLERAIKYYKKGLEKYPEHSIARCNLGNIYVKYEDFQSAVDEYGKALEYDPKYIVCRMNRGIVASEKLADYDLAIREYETILNTKRFTIHIPFIFNSVKPTRDNKTIALYNMGLAYRGKSMLIGEDTYTSNYYLKKAIECYEKAIKRTKKSFDLYFNYALANHILGDYKKAGQGYCKAMELEPMSFDAHYNHALLLKHLKKYKESIDELEKASLIVDTQTDIAISKYVFDIIYEVNQKLVATDRYKYLVEQNKEEHWDQESQLVYREGKVYLSDDYEEEMKKNFSRCAGRMYFANKKDKHND